MSFTDSVRKKGDIIFYNIFLKIEYRHYKVTSVLRSCINIL